MTVQGITTILVALAAAFTDFRYGKIYNWLTYPAVLAGFALSLTLHNIALSDSVIAFVVALVVFYLLHRTIGLGAGDVKLMAAVGALSGLSFTVLASYYAVCAGSVLGLLLLAWKGTLLASLRWLGSTLYATVTGRPQPSPPASGLTNMPFGPAICIGVIYTSWLRSRGDLSIGLFSF